MPKDRKYIQRKKLGSTRVDLSLKKKMEYIWKITFNESYKKVSQDFRKVSPKIISSSWRKTGTPRFASFDSVAADEQATLIHQLEMLEIEEEVMEEDDVAIVKVPKNTDVPQAISQPEKKRIQSQITAFFLP